MRTVRRLDVAAREASLGPPISTSLYYRLAHTANTKKHPDTDRAIVQLLNIHSKMRIKYLICSESSSFDQFTGRVSLFHLMDQIIAPTYPVAIPQISVIVCMEREENEPDSAELKIQIKLGAQELMSYPASIQFRGGTIARAVGNLQGFYVPAAGRLTASATFEGNTTIWEIDCVQVGEFQFLQPSGIGVAPQPS